MSGVVFLNKTAQVSLIGSLRTGFVEGERCKGEREIECKDKRLESESI